MTGFENIEKGWSQIIKLIGEKCKRCGKELLEIEQYKDFTYREKEIFSYCIKCEKRQIIEKR